MRLRKQLLLASLFTLSLPWVGCQYIQEMEQTLRAGQDAALEATAVAVAATLENDATLLDELIRFDPPQQTTPIYLHNFARPLLLDGYQEEWTNAKFDKQVFNVRAAVPEQLDLRPLNVLGAEHKDNVWMFFRIPDSDIAYFNPTTRVEASDHLRLTCRNIKFETFQYSIVASSPGQAQVFKMGTEKPLIEHKVKAIWREWESGYQIEIQLPKSLCQEGLSFNVMDYDALASNDPSTTAAPSKHIVEPRYSNTASVRTEELAPLPIIRSHLLTQALAIFKQPGTSLKLASSGGAFIAAAGTVAPPETPNAHWLLAFVYRYALNTQTEGELPNPYLTGYFARPEVLTALHGKHGVSLYSRQGHSVSSIGVPVTSNGRSIGVVIAEQGTNSLQAFTNTAFNRLLIYSMLVLLGSAVILVSYATWLSIRISWLSRSASEAISDTGKITDEFKASHINDEIGDLSRSFAQLISRLKEYTHYLKTLSSKLSHELRTPLAIVSSSLDNLEHEDIPPQALTYAKRAKEGTARLSNILNSMSAASRVEQAIGAAEIEKIPLDQMLENLRDAYCDVYPQVHFGLSIQTNRNGFELLGAGELLVQMMDKLVDNAADFCPNGGLIEFGLYRQQDTLVITVRNEGPVLPNTMQRQLFDSMVSVRMKPRNEDAHHLGLGLYIVRLIVDFHQGSVECYNVPDNSGVIFEIRLPITS